MLSFLFGKVKDCGKPLSRTSGTNPLRMPMPDFIRWMSRRGRDILESPLTYDETLNNKALSFIYIDPYDGVAVNYGKFEGLVEWGMNG